VKLVGYEMPSRLAAAFVFWVRPGDEMLATGVLKPRAALELPPSKEEKS
jgi:hypothetical protein